MAMLRLLGHYICVRLSARQLKKQRPGQRRSAWRRKCAGKSSSLWATHRWSSIAFISHSSYKHYIIPKDRLSCSFIMIFIFLSNVYWQELLPPLEILMASTIVLFCDALPLDTSLIFSRHVVCALYWVPTFLSVFFWCVWELALNFFLSFFKWSFTFIWYLYF